jgi:hypothetical protein
MAKKPNKTRTSKRTHVRKLMKLFCKNQFEVKGMFADCKIGDQVHIHKDVRFLDKKTGNLIYKFEDKVMFFDGMYDHPYYKNKQWPTFRDADDIVGSIHPNALINNVTFM